MSKTGYVSVNDNDEVNGNVVVNDSDESLDITLYIASPEGYTGIYSWSDLNAVRYGMTAQDKYILMNDLDSSSDYYDQYASSNANGGEGWQPIGNSFSKFQGTFDGNNNIISDLYINRPSEDYIGLFGYMISNVKNLGLEQVDITGHNYVGALAGYLMGDYNTIENCYSKGDIAGVSIIGGLIGRNHKTTIINCYSSAYVYGTGSDAGGLVGYNTEMSEIYESYASGNVSGHTDVGGLVGLNSASTIEKSYATGNVTGNGEESEEIGGLIGTNNIGFSSTTSNVKDTYATGDVSGYKRIGGLIGNLAEGNLYNSYSIGNVTGTNNIGGLIGRNYGYVYDSICLINASYEIIGYNPYTDRISGRVTEAPQEDMQKDDIYTEITLTDYDEMDTIWESFIWNFGTEANPAYPTLSWE